MWPNLRCSWCVYCSHRTLIFSLTEDANLHYDWFWCVVLTPLSVPCALPFSTIYTCRWSGFFSLKKELLKFVWLLVTVAGLLVSGLLDRFVVRCFYSHFFFILVWRSLGYDRADSLLHRFDNKNVDGRSLASIGRAAQESDAGNKNENAAVCQADASVLCSDASVILSSGGQFHGAP